MEVEVVEVVLSPVGRSTQVHFTYLQAQTEREQRDVGMAPKKHANVLIKVGSSTTYCST